MRSATGSGKGGKTGELVCEGGIFRGEVLAGQPNGTGQFYASQVQSSMHLLAKQCAFWHFGL